MTLTLTGNALLGADFHPATLTFNNGRLTHVELHAESKADHYLVPGFIDLQLNGAYGDDFTTQGDTVTRVASRLPQTGCTAFLPTLITSPFDSYPQRLQQICEAQKQNTNGAHILGVHLEGPYFHPSKRGAHNPELLRPIEVAEIKAWADPSLVRIVTLAPELPNAPEAIAALTAQEIIVSAGHSIATYAEAQQGFASGLRWGTHLFNAMSSIDHREPGLAVAFLNSAVPCGLIADGVHVHPAMLQLAFKMKGVTGLCLVTDAMAAMGTSKRSSQIGDRPTLVDETSVRLADGTLAGSILKMDRAVRNMMRYTNCTLAQAVTMASRTPAQVLGLKHKGQLALGYDADIVVLDKSLEVVKTFVSGKLVYEN